MDMTHKQSAQLPAIAIQAMQKSVLRLENASPPPDKQTFSWSWYCAGHRPAAIVVAHPLSRHNKWPLNNAFSPLRMLQRVGTAKFRGENASRFPWHTKFIV